MLARVAELARSVPAADIAWAQYAIAVRAASYDVLAGFTGPAVVLAGAEDELVPLAEARRMAEVLPHGWLRVVPDAGHLLPLEAPGAVEAALAVPACPRRALREEARMTTEHAAWGFTASTGLAFTRTDIVDAHFDACRPTYLGLLGRVGIQPGSHVLDAGCGGGRFLPHLADLVGPVGRVSAVDLAAEHVELARARSADLPAVVEVRQGDVTALPYPDDTFGAAWCANTVQYLDDDQLRLALAELRRVVRPGGLVAVKELDASTVTARPGPPFLFTDFFRAAAVEPGYARQLLRSRELYRFLREAGLAEVRQHTVLSEHYAPFSPAERAYYGQACASLAAQAGADPDWRPYLDPDHPDNPLNAADAYICEGSVLAVGVVPG